MDGSGQAGGESNDLWNSGRLEKKPKVDPAADTAEWLGEASAEDVERSTKEYKDVYAPEDGPSEPEEPRTVITSARVERGDVVTPRIILAGLVILFGSMFIQVLRADTLKRPEVKVASTPTPGEDRVVAEYEREPDSLSAPKKRPSMGPAELPEVSEVLVTGEPGQKAIVTITLSNPSESPSLPAGINLELTPDGGGAFNVTGGVRPLPPGQSTDIEVVTPFEVKGRLSTRGRSFREKSGVEVTYDVEVTEAP